MSPRLLYKAEDLSFLRESITIPPIPWRFAVPSCGRNGGEGEKQLQITGPGGPEGGPWLENVACIFVFLG